MGSLDVEFILQALVFLITPEGVVLVLAMVPGFAIIRVHSSFPMLCGGVQSLVALLNILKIFLSYSLRFRLRLVLRSTLVSNNLSFVGAAHLYLSKLTIPM